MNSRSSLRHTIVGVSLLLLLPISAWAEGAVVGSPPRLLDASNTAPT